MAARSPQLLSTGRASGRGPQKAHSPHGGLQAMITWSPTLTSVTPSPTSAMMPAPSWPSMAGAGCGMVPFRHGQVGVAHAGGLDLDLHLAGADADELDVVPHLELVVTDVAKQCSAHVSSPWGWSPTGTRSSLTPRQMRNRGSTHDVRLLQVRPGRARLRRGGGSGRHRARRRRPAGRANQLRPPAPLARAREGRQRRRGAAERGEAGRGVPRRAAGRLVLRADQLPALGAGDRLHHPGLRARRRSSPTSATPR